MAFCDDNQYDNLCLNVKFYDYFSRLDCKYDDALEVPYFAPDDLNSGPSFFVNTPIHGFCPGGNNQHGRNDNLDTMTNTDENKNIVGTAESEVVGWPCSTCDGLHSKNDHLLRWWKH